MLDVAKEIAGLLAIAVLLSVSSCQSGGSEPDAARAYTNDQLPANAEAQVTPTSPFPNLQAEILDERYRTTSSPIGQIDFKNYTYPLPRGWQHPDGSDLTLANGKIVPVPVHIHEDMDDEEKIERRAMRRIGMSHVITKYLDTTGDGQDEAVVILKVETTGNAIPQFVYVFDWRNEKPELIWYFRTGDRADGGLKDIRLENGELTVELFGQDRFILGETETMKITGDEQQLCCPTYYTRTTYRWNGSSFLLNKGRWTYSMEDPSAAPIENMADVVNAREKSKRVQIAEDR